MPERAEMSNGQSLGFRVSPLWLGLGAVALAMWALLLFGLPFDRPSSLASIPYLAETTGSGSATTESGPSTTGYGSSMAAAPEPEIDILTGTPLMRLGPADLVAGSAALKHPAFPPKAKLKSMSKPNTRPQGHRTAQVSAARRRPL